ncbi:ABC transporter ATP-binding protein [Lacticaseibacillus absianus]|uniref:ABC transporter ATP-binding protein n=1 Tax=Lacticaseibacillus absianus TaxID=2729623 RepID=UPI0015CA42ED|nr:ABC transporter ATP-binding protein [Lacticaseibacillus absianus]
MAKSNVPYSLANNLRWYWGVLRRAQPNLQWSLLGYVATTAILGIVSVALPAWLVALLATAAHFDRYVGVALGLAAAVAGATAMHYFFDMHGNNFSGNLRGKLQLRAHRDAFAMDYQTLIRPETQDLYSRANDNALSWTLAGGQAIFFGLEMLLADGLTMLIFVVTLSAFTPLVLFLVLLAVTISYLALQRYRHWYAANKGEWSKTAKQKYYLRRTAYELANGKDMRLYKTHGWYHDHFQALVDTRMAWQRKRSTREMLSEMIAEFAGLIRDAVAYGTLILGVAAGTLSLSRFTLLFGVTNQFVALTSRLLADWDRLTKASLDLQELRAFYDMADVETGTVTPAQQAALAQRPVEITFDHVSYAYPGAETDSLVDLSFTMHGGEKLALVGINGAGKSTLARLMMGLFTPTRGRILVNGIDAATLPASARYALFAPVFQTSELMATTVAQNVALAATPDAQRVTQALAQAGLADKVASLPQGDQTQMTRNIDDDGVEFSGGQLQKLMLARALYKDAPVLILDEPTAALDPLAENEIYTEYAQLTAHKSALFISHRLASTRFCDRIIVLANGRITAQGSHAALMAQDGDYAQMYCVQSKYYQQEVTADED